MRRTTVATCAATALLGGVATVFTPAVAHADSCADGLSGAPLPLASGACADVLAQEGRWLTAITAGDVGTVESILAPTFTHINSEGKILDRAAEIAAMAPSPVSMTPSDQRVTIVGDTAVIHGVNTLGFHGEVMGVERFTDVFVLQDGVWKAVSAQETDAAE